MKYQERQAARAAKQTAREERQATRGEKVAAREEKVAAREEKVAAREERKDERAERDFQKCVKTTLPQAIESMRNDCIKNPGGQSCKSMLQGNYPVCAPVSYLRGKPPTKEETDCISSYMLCKENLLQKTISDQAARCAANPDGQDCKDIAAKRFPRCASCGE
jgi:hypothetical protein